MGSERLPEVFCKHFKCVLPTDDTRKLHLCVTQMKRERSHGRRAHQRQEQSLCIDDDRAANQRVMLVAHRDESFSTPRAEVKNAFDRA